jgi:hypothetical protein
MRNKERELVPVSMIPSLPSHSPGPIPLRLPGNFPLTLHLVVMPKSSKSISPSSNVVIAYFGRPPIQRFIDGVPGVPGVPGALEVAGVCGVDLDALVELNSRGVYFWKKGRMQSRQEQITAE